MISGEGRVAGVLGWPVRHSISPLIHGWWLESYGIDGAYVPLAVRPDDFATVLAALPKLGFAGWNVTLPHKQAACALVHDLTQEARACGAVNTVVVGPEGQLHGANTDGFGFIASLGLAVRSWHTQVRSAVILGAGGGARAVAAALLGEGIGHMTVVNRSADRARHLTGDLGGQVQVGSWDRRQTLLEGTDLLVNTTSLGMVGQPPLDLDLSLLPRRAIVADIVYVPLRTSLLRQAEARGNPTVDGLGMLLHQARPGFAAWFGIMPDVTDALRAHLVLELERRCSSSD
jgi:shikimate dehydrogenase